MITDQVRDQSGANHDNDCESLLAQLELLSEKDEFELDFTEREELELDESIQNQLDEEILNLRLDRRSMVKKSFRWFNVATFSFCLVAALLRPTEDKIIRRAQPRSMFDSRNMKKIARRFLGNNNNYYYEGQGNANDTQNDDQQNDDAVDADGNDVYYNTTDDQYYNATNATEEDYYQTVDDFYTYIGDDNTEEMKLFPLELTDFAGFVCVAITIITSIGGGIGPGAILVAVYIIVMDFPPKVAIPLSCVTGLGINTFGNFLNAGKRHPLSNRPIIDWDLVLVMEPVILLGAIIGTYVNKILEGKTLVVLLVLLLSVIAHNTLKRARRMHQTEELYIKRVLWAKQKRMNAQALSNSSVYPGSFDNKLAEADPPFAPKIHSMSPATSTDSHNGSRTSHKSRRGGDKKASLLDNSDLSDNKSRGSFNLFINLRKEDAESVKSSLIEEEAEPLPQSKITFIITMFLVVIAMNVLKGGIAFESPLGVQCGSFVFWTFEFLTGIWLITCTCLAGKYLLRRHAIKEAVGFDYVRGDIKWDVRTVVIYPTACLLAGAVAGMFGIGVAVMVGPMLVGIGVNPAVAAATCGTMNFFTSLAATSSYVVLGSIIPDREYAIFLFCLGITCSFIGSRVVQKTKSSTKIENNKRLERHSYMAYSMGVVVLVSALCMTVEALLDVINHSFDEDELDGVCMEERIY
eukprot:scaffold5451_cov245-Chaetoceros_neogracile.AAC.4